MGVLTGPLFSLTASGTVGKTLTYSTWRGRRYVRTRVIPKNPRTTEQTNNRNAFSTLAHLWTNMPAEAQSPWTIAAKGQPLTNRNLLVKDNAKLLEFNADWQDFRAAPGNSPAAIPTGVSIVGGVGKITFDADSFIFPTGYTFVEWVMLAWLNTDPTTGYYPIVMSTNDNSNPLVAFDWTGFDAGEYYATIYARITQSPVIEPTNAVRYSPDVHAIVTIT